jgi:adenosylcobinamide-GDP ribazoletransferase
LRGNDEEETGLPHAFISAECRGVFSVASDDWRTTGYGPAIPEPAPHGAEAERPIAGDPLADDPPPAADEHERDAPRHEEPPPRAPETPAGLLAGWWRDIAQAVTFLTRIPFQIDGATAARPLAAAARGFPVAGLVVGVAGAVALTIADAVGLPQLASALIGIAATALVAGGLHEDGLADTVDGLFGGRDRGNALAIMRDSRIGAYGALALIFTVGLKATALEALEPGAAAAALIAAEVAGRAALPAVMALMPPARGDGLSFDAGRPRREDVLLALLVGAVVVLLMLGIAAGIAALIVAAAAAALVARAAFVRLGGQTGDVLGAIEQVAATAVLLAAAAVV